MVEDKFYDVAKRKVPIGGFLGAQTSLGTGGAIINSDGVRGISVWDGRSDGRVASHVASQG
ncbi:hypothetical protein WN943_026546 [Citrus x changshan-huyou]